MKILCPIVERLIRSVCEKLAKLSICVLLLCLLILPVLADEAQMPLAATFAGDYITANSGESGAEEFSRYLYSSTILTVKPYTEQSRSKVIMFSTAISSPIIARGSFISYHEILTQVEPGVFTDMRGNKIAFSLDESGKPIGIDFSGSAYVPLTAGRSPLVINSFINLFQFLLAFSIFSLLVSFVYFIKNTKASWKSFIATRINSCLTLVLALALANNAILLVYSISTLPYAQCNIHFILNYVLLGVIPALIVALCCTWRKSELIRRQKVCYILNIIASLLMLMIILFWQLYR